jgi:transcriptional regulator with XRE-family HTH domain
MPRKKPDPIDELVGRNIRIHRLAKGLSQTALADKLGLTFQQVQKYEKGTNRVGSGRLFRIAAILDVDVITLFDGIKEQAASKGRPSPMDLISDRQSFRLVQAFSRIDDQGVRRSIVELVENISGSIH